MHKLRQRRTLGLKSSSARLLRRGRRRDTVFVIRLKEWRNCSQPWPTQNIRPFFHVQPRAPEIYRIRKAIIHLPFSYTFSLYDLLPRGNHVAIMWQSHTVYCTGSHMPRAADVYAHPCGGAPPRGLRVGVKSYTGIRAQECHSINGSKVVLCDRGCQLNLLQTAKSPR